MAERRGREDDGVNVESVALRHCDVEAKVKVAGSGPPLVYLHPLWDYWQTQGGRRSASPTVGVLSLRHPTPGQEGAR